MQMQVPVLTHTTKRVGGSCKVNWGEEQTVWFVGSFKREPQIFMFSLITFMMGKSARLHKGTFLGGINCYASFISKNMKRSLGINEFRRVSSAFSGI